MLTSVNTVPSALRRWFIVHFIADVVVAIPLLAVPTTFLRTLGWTAIDPIAARMVGAALAGIGVESFLCRNDSVEVFRAMLRLKCIWSGVAVAGVSLSIAQGAPPAAWGVLAVFVGFAVVWNIYRLRLRASGRDASLSS